MKVLYNFLRILSRTQKGFTMKSNKFNASFGCLSKLRMPATKNSDDVAKKDDIWLFYTDVVEYGVNVR